MKSKKCPSESLFDLMGEFFEKGSVETEIDQEFSDEVFADIPDFMQADDDFVFKS